MHYFKLWTTYCLLTISILVSFYCFSADPSPFESTKNLPIAYQGRFRSLDASARLWLYDFYHSELIKIEHLAAFKTADQGALNLLWRTHFVGRPSLDEAPLFWIRYASLKSLIGIDPSKARFSYSELTHAINEDKVANLNVLRYLLVYEFAKAYRSPTNRSRAEKIELRHLVPGLWIGIRDKEMLVASSPNLTPPWHFLKAGMHLADLPMNLELVEKQNKSVSDDFLQLLRELQEYEKLEGSKLIVEEEYTDALRLLKNQGLPPREIAQALEERYPLRQRLKQAGTTLKMLPSQIVDGEWLSLHALKVGMYDHQLDALIPVDNFTTFTDAQFAKIREIYREVERTALVFFALDKNLNADDNAGRQLEVSASAFTSEMASAYQMIVEKPYKIASSKSLSYPSLSQIKAETMYYRLPLIGSCLAAYALALLFFIAAVILDRKYLDFAAWTFLLLAFIIHTAILALRCYVLQRPPVSNMFETVIYVPWVAMAIALSLQKLLKSRIPVIGACIASLALLILIKISHADARMENVQAVLDSQYWLIVHVLMIVGSYGVFIVSGLLGHYFLFVWAKKGGEDMASHFAAKCILQTMYIGVALLIPGTILGGVWAAESWGRFWDWDPKESWAFISACVYLLIIHAYTFRKIYDAGLAVGSIFGLMAISFTWYGVNYILGTGLHSYGFGNGGEMYYYGYLISEFLFIAGAIASFFYNRQIDPKKGLIKK